MPGQEKPIPVSKDALEKLRKKSETWATEDRAVFEALLSALLLQARIIYRLEVRLENFADYFRTLSSTMDRDLSAIGELLSARVAQGVSPQEVDEAIRNLSEAVKNNEELSEILAKALKMAAKVAPLLIA